VHATWLGHSTIVLELDGVRILTDPLLRPHVGLLRRRGPQPAPALWRDPDVVLLSHLHHDHADLGSLRMLPAVLVMSDPVNVAWLRRRRGLGPARSLGDGWSPVGRGVEVRQVPAVHRHRPMPHRPNAAHGHLVRGPSGRVWIAGDTELYPAMERLPDLAGGPLDLAVVPVWGWGPRLSGGHLSPEQAARAVAVTGARVAIPVHWGTLHPPLATRVRSGWFTLPGERFAAALAELAPEVTAVVLRPGQSWTRAE
jgi:L-ascorbate metabolism protein UlaG (beta-lactamase superfamily)